MENPAQGSTNLQNIWQSQIRRELKLDADSVLRREIEPGIFLDPTLTAAEVPDVLKIKWPEQPWLPGMQLAVTDIQVANAALILALRQGVQSVWLTLHRKMELPDYQNLFAGIQLEMISLFIDSADSGWALDSWRELDQFLSLQDQVPATGGFFFPDARNPDLSQPDREDFMMRYPTWYWWKIDPDRSNNFVDRLTSVLQKVNQLQVSGPAQVGRIDNWLDRCLVVWPGDNRILAQLAATRALHLLWQQLYFSQPANPLTILGVIDPQAFTDDPNTNLIRSAAMATTMALSGIHSMYIAPSDEAGTLYRRMSINIQHLLQLESHLQVHDDLVSGSYTIDDLTSQYAHETWKRWQKHIG